MVRLYRWPNRAQVEEIAPDEASVVFMFLAEHELFDEDGFEVVDEQPDEDLEDPTEVVKANQRNEMLSDR